MNEQIIPTLTESIVYSGSGGVTSVNGYTGDVVLDAEDVGAASTTDLAAKADKNNGTLTGTTVAENITVSGDLTADSLDVETSITVPTPASDYEAATKKYVDDNAGGGDSVYSTKTTSNSATGGAVFIGDKDANQNVIEDPTTTDNHYKYFYVLPASTTKKPGDNSVVILGDCADGAGHSVVIGKGAHNADGNNIAIGTDTYAAHVGNVALGTSANASSYGTAAIGYYANTTGRYGVAIGKNTSAGQEGSVAIGYGSSTSAKGEFSIGGTSVGTSGYNSTQYRLLTNVYDGQSAHDAVNKQQLDGAIISGGTTAPTTSTVGKVGTLYACVESGTGKLYICTAADDTTSTYTWSALI